MSNFHGCVLRASTYVHEPFVISNNKKDINVTQYSEGLEIGVLQTIASQLNFTVEYLPEPDSMNYKRRRLYEEVSKKQSDVGFAAAAHSSHAIDERDYTIGYVRETVKWFGPLPKPVPHWKGFVILFTPLMWLLVLIVYLIASIIFWSLANVHRSVNEHVSYKNPVVCFFHTFSVVLGEAVFVRPQTWFLRSFFVVWVYYCLLINTAYQSSLISVLTQPRFEPTVDTVEELVHSQMPYGYTTLVKHWYNESEDAASKTILADGIECPSLDHCLKRIISTQDFAVCGLGYHMLYLSYKKIYSYDARGPKFIPFKDEVLSYLASMFFRTGSPHLESFNRIIYRLVESGMVQNLWESIKLQHTAKKEQAGYEYGDGGTDGGRSDAVVLTVDHLHGAFILILLGLACGLVVFLGELICFRLGKRKFIPLLNTSVRDFKSRIYVNYKHHVIHKTLLRHVKKRNLRGKVKKVTLK
jgi:hypothetical protein